MLLSEKKKKENILLNSVFFFFFFFLGGGGGGGDETVQNMNMAPLEKHVISEIELAEKRNFRSPRGW